MQIKIEYKIGQIMNERNITLRQLEIMSGVGRSTIDDIKNGKSDPNIETICKLMIALKVKFEALVTIKIIEK